MARAVPISVVETPEFLSTTRKLMSNEERALLVDYLAYNPTAGDLIPGTGRRAEAAMGIGRSRQARRRAGDLLPPRRRHAARRADRLRQERAGRFEPAGPQ